MKVKTREAHSATRFTVSAEDRCSRRNVRARRLWPGGGVTGRTTDDFVKVIQPEEWTSTEVIPSSRVCVGRGRSSIGAGVGLGLGLGLRLG